MGMLQQYQGQTKKIHRNVIPMNNSAYEYQQAEDVPRNIGVKPPKPFNIKANGVMSITNNSTLLSSQLKQTQSTQNQSEGRVRKVKVPQLQMGQDFLRNNTGKFLGPSTTDQSIGNDFQSSLTLKSKLIEAINILMKVNDCLLRGAHVSHEVQDTIQGFIIQNQKILQETAGLNSESQQLINQDDKLEETIARLQQEMMHSKEDALLRYSTQNAYDGIQQTDLSQSQYIERTNNNMLIKSLELNTYNDSQMQQYDNGGKSQLLMTKQQPQFSNSKKTRDRTVGIPKRRKKLLGNDPFDNTQSQVAGGAGYQSTGRGGAFGGLGIGQSIKRGSVSSSRRSKNYKREFEITTNMGDQQSILSSRDRQQQSPMHVRKSIKQRKQVAVNYPGGSDNYQLQEVGVFKNFLIQNDSQYAEYVGHEFVLNLLDSFMMKESMISYLAQLMGGSSQSKDNLYLRTRSALQDTLGLFFIAKNIGQNNSVEFYLPRLIEMLSDMIDVERCSIYLYDKIKDEIYCKVITGRMKDPICFSRQQDNILCQAFNTGESIYIKRIENEQHEPSLQSYLQTVDSKLHQVTRSLMIVPIRLGEHSVGCLELANKRSSSTSGSGISGGGAEFTDHDLNITSQLCEELAQGLISYELKHNLKKEFDEELKHVKGLVGEIYQQTINPLIQELEKIVKTTLRAEKVVIFMHNKDIDHLYSYSQTDCSKQQNPFGSNFGIETIRMRSNVGLAGRAFSRQKIYREKDMSKVKHLAAEEKDLQKLKLKEIRNVIAIPVLERQNNQSICVIQVYNLEQSQFEGDTISTSQDQSQIQNPQPIIRQADPKLSKDLLWSLSSFLSAVLFTLDIQQGTLLTTDILEAQFNLINEGVLLLNTMGVITKLNKSAEVMLNQSAELVVGKSLSELLSPNNSHLFHSFAEVMETKQMQVLQMTELRTKRATQSNTDEQELRIPINFYVSRLNDVNRRAHGYCLVLQPIIVVSK